jgi:hypothetical protein
VAAGPYTEIFYMLCRRTTPDPSTRFGIGYRGRKRCSAYTRTFSKLSTSLLTVTKSLRRGGPLCPPVLPDMLAVFKSVTAGRRGSRPLRGNCLHVLPSHYSGSVYTFRNLLRRGSRPLRGNFLHALPSHYVGSVYTFRNLLRRGSRPRLTSLLRLAASG